MTLRALTWNLFHGRDFAPDATLRTWRSRLLRLEERGKTHVQVNRDLFGEFAQILSGAAWDVALLQESPPRWASRLAGACGAEAHMSLTSRNSLGAIRAVLAHTNPDLMASNEGGSNLTLIRPGAGRTVEHRELELRPGPDPERRTMVFVRIVRAGGDQLCVANLHASAGRSRQAFTEQEVLLAASRSVEWAAGSPLILGGDLNLRPEHTALYEELAERFGLAAPTAPGSLDHLLARGLDTVEAPETWPAERRDVPDGDLAIRLSDHAPVEALFASNPPRHLDP